MRAGHLRVIIVVAIAALLTCAARDEVVVIAMTRTYHRSECFRVAMARVTKMPAAEARALGMAPCDVCRPDDQR